MLSYPLNFVTIMLVLELFEAAVQYAPTLGDAIDRLYRYYKRSVFLFFAVHPSFAFVLFVILKTGAFNIAMLFIVAFKIFDIFYKLEIIKTRYLRRQRAPELEAMLSWPVPPWMFLLNVAIYVPTLYWALTSELT